MVVQLYIKLIPYKDCFLKVLPELSNSIAKCLLDPYDMLKLVTYHHYVGILLIHQ